MTGCMNDGLFHSLHSLTPMAPTLMYALPLVQKVNVSSLLKDDMSKSFYIAVLTLEHFISYC